MEDKENKNNLLTKLIKNKHLQKLSNSQCMIIPKPWINALKWDNKTDLIMSLDPDGKKIIIRESNSSSVKVETEKETETDDDQEVSCVAAE
jgi:bifunctional DNA-binding transcriptional regulator/antitoxin component of YhaV-PrlF toxin-antitoxin module